MSLVDGERAARRAIEIRRGVVASDSPEVAADLAPLAVLVAVQGRLDEAEPLHHRALAIFRRAYGPDHYEVAVNLNGLAAVGHVLALLIDVRQGAMIGPERTLLDAEGGVL